MIYLYLYQFINIMSNSLQSSGETRAQVCTSRERSFRRERKDGRGQISARNFLFSSCWPPLAAYQGESGLGEAPGQRYQSVPWGQPQYRRAGLSGYEIRNQSHPEDFPPETFYRPPGPSQCPPAGRCSGQPPAWSGAAPRGFYPSVSWPVCTSRPSRDLPTAACISHSGSRPTQHSPSKY